MLVTHYRCYPSKAKCSLLFCPTLKGTRFIKRQQDVMITFSIINSSIAHLLFTYSVAGFMLDPCCPMTSISYMWLLST